MNKKHVALAGVLLLAYFLGVNLKSSRKTVQSETFEDEVVIVKKKLTKRQPASVAKTQKALDKNQPSVEVPSFSVSDREKYRPETGFQSEKVGSDLSGSGLTTTDVSRVSNQSARGSRSGATTSPTSPKSKAATTAPNTSMPGGTIHFSNTPGVPTTPAAPGTNNNNNSNNNGNNNSGSNTSSNNNDNEPPAVCSANIGGGSFNGPVSVELTCSNTSSIKYCVSEGVCCNPETGSSYTGPITIGQASKTFCLSYTGGDDITEATYTFNADLPHLDVTQRKLQLQTTQLDTQLIIMSNNFGSNHHSTGLINFRQNNPQTMALNCQEAVEFVPGGWAGGGNITALADTPVFPYAPTDQINVNLNLSKLSYGENNFVSYVKSSQYEEELFACQYSKIILRDFYYFTNLPIEMASAHEFTGGFSPIGPGEDNSSVYRGPASDLNSTSLEELRSGLLSIFYDN